MGRHLRQLRELFVILQDHQRRDADVLAVVIGYFAVQQLHALPEMGHDVLRAAAGAGGLGEAHRDAGQQEGFEDRGCGLFVALRDASGHGKDLVGRLPRERGDALTIGFPGQKIRYLPVDQRDVFGDHIAEARGFERRRGVRQDLRVADDDLGTFGGIRDLEIPVHDGRGVGREAVHRRGSGEQAQRYIVPRAGKPAWVVDRPRPDGQHAVDPVKITLDLLHVLHRRHADGRPDVPHDGKAGERGLDALRRGERLLVCRQQQARAEAVLPENIADAADKTAADLDIPDGARMRLPAGAVLVAVDQRVEISHDGSSFCMVNAPEKRVPGLPSQGSCQPKAD